MKHQSSGELDEAKLIEGLTGERAIYKRRGDKEPEVRVVEGVMGRVKLIEGLTGERAMAVYKRRMDKEPEVRVLEGKVGEG